MNNPSILIIEEIRRRLPNKVNLIDFFTEILPMKKEAAYRRLRGEIPLSLGEATQIASYLHLSLDKLLHVKEEETYTSSIIRMNGQNVMDAYCKTIGQIIDALKFMKTDPKSAHYSAINVLPGSHVFRFPTISKFRLFKWAYQCRSTLNPPKLSEIEIPSYVRYLESTYVEVSQHIASYFVFIRDLFVPYIRDIYYFYELGLLSKDEVNLLKEETFQLMDVMEEDISAGATKYGIPFMVYLSNTYFDSSYIYVEGNGFKASSINVFGINYLSSTEAEISDDTKEWIESLIRYSTLISKSGEIEKVNFFNLQRNMLTEYLGRM